MSDKRWAVNAIRKWRSCDNILAKYDFCVLRELESLAKSNNEIRKLLLAELGEHDGADPCYALYVADLLVRVDAPGTLRALVRVLRDKTRSTKARWHAADALGRLGTRAIPALAEAIVDVDPEVRASAAGALAHLRLLEESKPVMLLIQALADESSTVRQVAIASLSQWPAQSVAGYLRTALEATDPFVRAGAASACLALKVNCAEAERILLPLLRHGNIDVRLTAVRGLGDEKRNLSKAALEPLRAALNEQGQQIRLWAVHALGNMRGKAKAAVPDLVSLMNQDNDESVRIGAAAALATIGRGCTTAVQALVKAAEARDFSAAIVALGNMGPSAREAIPALQVMRKRWRALGHEDLILRALAKIDR